MICPIYINKHNEILKLIRTPKPNKQLSHLLLLSMSLLQDWKSPRTSKAFTGMDRQVSPTVLRCVTNSKIPCTAQEFNQMGKTRFTLTVIGIGSVGYALAPYKKPTGSKKVPKDPHARALFELVRNEGTITGVKMFSFKKAKNNFDRDEIDLGNVSEIHIGQVLFVLF